MAEGGIQVHGEIELIWLDPQRIDLWCSNPPQRALDDGVSVLGGPWDSNGVPLEETYLFKALRDRFVLGKEWEETPYWDQLTEIEAGNPVYDCHDEREFRAHLAYVDELYGWIEANGFKTHRELGGDHDPNDEITIGIGRDGRLIAFSKGLIGGRHRLSIARLLGLPEVAARVLVRHEEWVELKQAIGAIEARVRRTVCELIDHPDLAAP